MQRPRFAPAFSTRSLAKKFVESNRNGLPHDGETRSGWRVRQQSPDGKILDKDDDGWIVYRNQFHAALEEEFRDYLTDLQLPASDRSLRRNFLLRMDSICGTLSDESRVLYFAYGSNMSLEQISTRIPGAVRIGIGHLREHRVVFNKCGADGSGKANIAPDRQGGAGVWGIVFEISKEQLKTLAGYEKGYFRRDVMVSVADEVRQAATFVAEPSALKQIPPRTSYWQRISDGARELPQEYKDQLTQMVDGLF